MTAAWEASSKAGWRRSACTAFARWREYSWRSRSSTSTRWDRLERPTARCTRRDSSGSRSEAGPLAGARDGSAEGRAEVDGHVPVVRVPALVGRHACARGGRPGVDAVEEVVVLEAAAELERADV